MQWLPAALSTLSLFAFATPAFADCPPLGTLPGYVPEHGSPALRAHDKDGFLVGSETDHAETAVAGRTCRAVYTFPYDGGSPMSDLEIQSNYREQLRGLGATLTYTSSRDTHANLDRNGTKTWFHVYSQEDRIEITVIEAKAHATVLSKPAQGDSPLLGRMPGYALREAPETRNFDEAGFRVVDADGNDSEVVVQGARHTAAYVPVDGARLASDLDIHETYRAAIRARGGEILQAEARDTTARMPGQAGVAWVKVYSQEDLIEVTVIEEKPFASSLQPPAADALRSALEAQGRIALYLNFDFGKATLREDAEPVITQVVALLQGEPALRVSIEGHTDDVGSDSANAELSRARAAAVAGVLVARGIDATRLESEGFGESRPLAANDTSEGRARNRRVELVKR